MFFEVVGVLLAAVIQGLVISFFGSLSECDLVTSTPSPMGSTMSDAFNMSTISGLTTSSAASPGYNKMGKGFLLSAGIISIIYLICTSTAFFGTKEINGRNVFIILLLLLFNSFFVCSKIEFYFQNRRHKR